MMPFLTCQLEMLQSDLTNADFDRFLFGLTSVYWWQRRDWVDRAEF
jgi:hypothetical protein